MASCSEESAATAEEEPTETVASQKREARLRKFRELHFKRNEARKLNHQEVVEEDKRLKLPSNWEAKKARLEWELAEDQKKKECAARGEDYSRVKLLDITADDAERWERKKKKKNPDTGFAAYTETLQLTCVYWKSQMPQITQHSLSPAYQTNVCVNQV